MSVVVDSSITLAWYFIDEQTPGSRSVLKRVVEDGAVVPPLWRFEVANALQMAIRRNRIDIAFRDRALAHLRTLPISIDGESERQVWSTTVRLAERHTLTIYDAAYLELAQRTSVPLATLDTALIRAAAIDAMPVLGN